MYRDRDFNDEEKKYSELMNKRIDNESLFHSRDIYIFFKGSLN